MQNKNKYTNTKLWVVIVQTCDNILHLTKYCIFCHLIVPWKANCLVITGAWVKLMNHECHLQARNLWKHFKHHGCHSPHLHRYQCLLTMLFALFDMERRASFIIIKIIAKGRTLTFTYSIPFIIILSFLNTYWPIHDMTDKR